MHKELLKAVTNLGSPKICVVGDFILDSYVYGDAVRISPEAPVAVLKVVERSYACGGSGSVVADLAALGGKPICLGVIGNDVNGRTLCGLLENAGGDVSGLIKAFDRPTISKQRLVGLAQHRHRQQLLRVDDECTDQLDKAGSDKLLALYKQSLKEVELVCLQDYDKGVLNDEFCCELIALAKKAGKKVLVDPAPCSDYLKYKGASVITPNRKETSLAVGFPIASIDDARYAAEILAEKLQLEAVVVTLDKEGAFLHTQDVREHLATNARTVYDVTGAGDMVLAMIAMSLGAGLEYKTAVELSNIAGGLEVEKFGCVTVSIDEIVNEIVSSHSKVGKIHLLDDLLGELEIHRHRNEKIVFTNGCFDVLHRGHIEYLSFCKQQGDVVVLGLNSDRSVRELKGPTRPVNNQHDRAAVLAALETVDHIVVFDEADPLKMIEAVGPDVLVKGEDWAEKGVVGREFVEANGGVVKLAPLVEGKSSTDTIKKMSEGNGSVD